MVILLILIKITQIAPLKILLDTIIIGKNDPIKFNATAPVEIEQIRDIIKISRYEDKYIFISIIWIKLRTETMTNAEIAEANETEIIKHTFTVVDDASTPLSAGTTYYVQTWAQDEVGNEGTM